MYALRLQFQSRKLKEGRVRAETKCRSEVPSDGLWQEMAGAVNDSHQMTDSVAICRLSLSAWMGSVCACASVCQDRRKADLSALENSRAADGQISSLLLPPAQSYHLAIGDEVRVHKALSSLHMMLKTTL